MSVQLNKALEILPKLPPEMLAIQLKLVIMERATAQAALDLRMNFTNEDAKTSIVTKFFFYYDSLDPKSKTEFYENVDELGKKYLEAWTFAGIYNFPYRDAVAATYLHSIEDRTDEDIQQHILECQTLEKTIRDLQLKQAVV